MPVRGMGTVVLLSKQSRVQISPAAQHQRVTARVWAGTDSRHRDGSNTLYRSDIALQPICLSGELNSDGAAFSLVGLQTHSASSAWAVRRRTMAAIRSTAPSIPVTLELRVRSYRRISPQMWPV